MKLVFIFVFLGRSCIGYRVVMIFTLRHLKRFLRFIFFAAVLELPEYSLSLCFMDKLSLSLIHTTDNYISLYL